MTLSPQHEMARLAHMAGLCVVPPREDGSKAPEGFWKQYQSQRPNKKQIDVWYGDEGRQGVGLVCGAVSGNLTMLEFENEDIWELYQDNADGTGLGEVLGRIATGWMERTPGGGVHLYYYCDEIFGNKKLARKPAPTPENSHRVDTLIETRCEGGFTVISPSSGRTHPSGLAYRLVVGGPDTIVAITPDEQKELFQLASVFDEMEVSKAPEPTYVGGLRPGDDFNARADWRGILEPHGWVFVFERDGVWYLRRPGKARGISATVNWNGLDLFRNFSSSTPFDDRAYSKFSVYAVLEHRGDFREAAKELVRKGYGERIQGGEDEVAGTSENLWRSPDPIERPGTPQFPVHALPESIRGYCRGVGRSVQVPYDYPALTMLSTLSTATRGRFEVEVEGTDYVEPLVLQTVLFADSGTRKSASFALVKKPLVRYERERRDADELAFSAWEVRMDMLEKDIAKAKKGGFVNEHALMALIREKAELVAERPSVTRLIFDDITPERLGVAIYEQRGSASIMAPEGGFFGNLAGRYSAGVPNMEYVLRGHNGEPLIIDRMGREIMVPASFVTIGISLQPEIVRELAKVSGFRGKGMAARLLPSFPQSLVGSRDVRNAEPVDRNDDAIWHSVISTILGIAEDCPTNERGDYHPYRLILGEAAKEVYYQYAEHVERQLAKGGGLHGMRDWGGKMVGHALRIAGLFHLVERGDDAIPWPISADTLLHAIEVMEYFVPHARYFLEGLDGITYGEHLDDMLSILRDMPEPIHRSSLMGKLREHRFYRGDMARIGDALDELELLGYARVVPGSKQRIELNPAVDRTTQYPAFQVRR